MGRVTDELGWAGACEAMDEVSEWAVSHPLINARIEVPLIPFFDNPTESGVGQRRILLQSAAH